MSNVIPWRPRGLPGDGADDPARDTAALASDLISLIEQVRLATARAAALPRPAPQVERAVQALLDTVTALERATDALTDEGEWVPF